MSCMTAKICRCSRSESSLQWQWSVRGHRLELGPLSLSHAGTYTCVAKNSEGRTQKDYTLMVQGTHFLLLLGTAFTRVLYGTGFESSCLPVPPTILNSDQASDVSAPMGEELSLECRANGLPIPRISWLKDGVSLERSDTHHIS